MAQIGDAGAAQLAQARKGRRVGRGAEQQVNAVASAFERRAVVRCAQAHQVIDTRSPGLAGLGALVQRAAREQAAHAVAEQHDTLERQRPGVEQSLQQPGQLGAVRRDVQAAVVVQVDGAVTAVAGQRGAVVVAFAAPLQIVHAQAMQQHHQTRAGARQAQLQRCVFQHQRAAFAAQRHRGGQGVARGGEVVAEHAVQRRDDRLAFCARQGLVVVADPGGQRRRQPREQGVDAAADPARHAADALVDKARDAASAARRGGRTEAREPRKARNALVHRFDQVGEPCRGVRGQTRGAAQVGSAHGVSAFHGGQCASRGRWPLCSRPPRRTH